MLYTDFDERGEKKHLYIADKSHTDSLYLDNSIGMPLLRIVKRKGRPNKYILVFWQFYFMNGDMFNLALFEVME